MTILNMKITTISAIFLFCLISLACSKVSDSNQISVRTLEPEPYVGFNSAEAVIYRNKVRSFIEDYYLQSIESQNKAFAIYGTAGHLGISIIIYGMLDSSVQDEVVNAVRKEQLRKSWARIYIEFFEKEV